MINLKKGNSISLEKDGRKLEKIYVGLNWGKVSKYWGLLQTSVDLDGSVSTFNSEKQLIDTVYFNKRISDDKAIKHSGDDRHGDSYCDDKDNEVISIDLGKISPKVESIVIYLNSYTGIEFDTIPYAKIRLFDRDTTDVNKVFATFNLSSEENFKGKVSMIMAKLVRNGNNWKFITVGEAVDSKRIKQTIELIRHGYL
jgi:tellurium resistance protein TerZ